MYLRNIFLFFIVFLNALNGEEIFEDDLFYSKVYKNQFLEKISENGSVLIDGCKIKFVEVNGSLLVKNSEISDIIVNGKSQFIKSNMFIVRINGFLSAVDSVFNDYLVVCSENIFFEDCSIQDIFIKKMSSRIKKQTVRLSGSSFIKNNLIFEEPEGILLLSPKSKIYGKIEKGVICLE